MFSYLVFLIFRVKSYIQKWGLAPEKNKEVSSYWYSPTGKLLQTLFAVLKKAFPPDRQLLGRNRFLILHNFCSIFNPLWAIWVCAKKMEYCLPWLFKNYCKSLISTRLYIILDPNFPWPVAISKSMIFRANIFFQWC